MKYLACLALLLFCVGCAGNQFTPEVEPPTPEQMQALLNAPVKTAKKVVETRFNLVVNPAAAFDGGMVRLTCYVPETEFTTARHINVGLIGLKIVGADLDHIENVVEIQDLTCGTYEAICDIGTKQTRQELVVHGQCNGGQH